MPGIFRLIKITDKKDYANQLQQGILHAKRLSWFRKKEKKENDVFDGLYDELDGVGQIKKLKETVFKIDGKDFTKYLPDPITIFVDEITNSNVFCMTAIHTGHYETITNDNLYEFIDYLKVEERCGNEFGEHAVVITDVVEFLNRVRRTIDSKGYRLAYRLVEYFDPQVQLKINPFSVEPVFYKRNQYKYQKEFRIAVNTLTVGNNPLEFDIGNIEDISVYMKTTEINNTIGDLLK